MKLRDIRWYQNSPNLKLILFAIFMINLLVILSHKKKISSEKIDWNDYKGILRESKRKGIGENGDPGDLNDPAGLQQTQHLSDKFGVSVLISDRISDSRALPDPRHLE